MSNFDLLAKSIGGKIVDNVDEQPPHPQAQEAQNVETNEPVVEQSTNQLKNEDSSLTTKEESTETPKEVNLDDAIKERFEGRFSSLDEIQKALEEKNEQPKFEYANETLEQLDKFVRDGWSVEEFLEVRSKDYESLDDKEAVKQMMMFEDKSLTREEVDLLFEDSFGYDEDVDSERDVKLKNIKLKKEAQKAKESLKNFQQTYQPKAVVQNKQYEEVQQKWQNSINDIKINEISVGESFKYQVDESDLISAKSDVSDLSSYFKKYIGPDGKENISRLVEDQLKIKLFDKAVSTAMTLAKSEGREEVITNRDNVTSPKEVRPDAPKTMSQQLFEQAKSKGFI